jgi:hypothetical protein
MWWPDATTQSDADLGRYDWVGLRSCDSDHIAELRAANPDIRLFGSNSAVKLNYVENDYNNYLNVELRSASLTWALTQVGSALTSAINSTTTTVPVAEITKSGLTLFAVGDVFIIDNELFKVSSINGLNLTVKRGAYMGTPAASHPRGARAACIISEWPGNFLFDVSENCPAADVGYGAEHWNDWNARRLHSALHAADWDGILIDWMVTSIGWLPGSVSYGLPVRSLDPDRSNTVITSYIAPDSAWNAGMLAYAAAARALVGPDAIIIPNIGARALTDLNGAIFENFPTSTTTPETWHRQVIGPNIGERASYLQWCAARSPSYATLEMYEDEGRLGANPFGTPGWQPDYRKMRYGLTTALMGDGFFSYEMATNGHGALGLMWFDEYDNAGAGKGYLGQPLGPAYSVTARKPDLLLGDGAFSTSDASNAWTLSTQSPVVATKIYEAGTCAVRVTTIGPNYKLALAHPFSVVAGKTYRVTFSAKASAQYNMGALIYDGTNGTNYYPDDSARVTTEWSNFSLPVTATKTGRGTLNFYFGDFPGTVWLDNVTVSEAVPEVWRREFTGGTALVNASDSAVTVDLGGTYHKIKGTQAPTVNDGSLVTAVTIPAKDGLVLLGTASTGTLRASATTLTYGQATTLRIAVPPASSTAVRIEKMTANSPEWEQVATLTIDASGAAQLAVAPLVTTDYRVVLVDTGTVSNVVTVGVKARVTIKSSKTTIRRRRPVTIGGKVTTGVNSLVGAPSGGSSPTVSNEVVRAVLQCRVGLRWITLKRVSMSSTGRYHVHIRPRVRGTHSYRIRVASSGANAAAVSRIIRIRVR